MSPVPDSRCWHIDDICWHSPCKKAMELDTKWMSQCCHISTRWQTACGWWHMGTVSVTFLWPHKIWYMWFYLLKTVNTTTRHRDIFTTVSQKCCPLWFCILKTHPGFSNEFCPIMVYHCELFTSAKQSPCVTASAPGVQSTMNPPC